MLNDKSIDNICLVRQLISISIFITSTIRYSRMDSFFRCIVVSRLTLIIKKFYKNITSGHVVITNTNDKKILHGLAMSKVNKFKIYFEIHKFNCAHTQSTFSLLKYKINYSCELK